MHITLFLHSQGVFIQLFVSYAHFFHLLGPQRSEGTEGCNWKTWSKGVLNLQTITKRSSSLLLQRMLLKLDTCIFYSIRTFQPPQQSHVLIFSLDRQNRFLDFILSTQPLFFVVQPTALLRALWFFFCTKCTVVASIGKCQDENYVLEQLLMILNNSFI